MARRCKPNRVLRSQAANTTQNINYDQPDHRMGEASGHCRRIAELGNAATRIGQDDQSHALPDRHGRQRDDDRRQSQAERSRPFNSPAARAEPRSARSVRKTGWLVTVGSPASLRRRLPTVPATDRCHARERPRIDPSRPGERQCAGAQSRSSRPVKRRLKSDIDDEQADENQGRPNNPRS